MTDLRIRRVEVLHIGKKNHRLTGRHQLVNLLLEGRFNIKIGLN